MADIPPWLNVQPAQFAQAAEAGARAGLQARIASEQNQRAIEEARLRRAAEDQMKQIRQFELQARINESAAKMSSADLRNRMAQAQIQRQIKNDAMAAMAKQAQLDIARQTLDLKKQQAAKANEPFTPTTMTVDGVQFGKVRPNAWVVTPKDKSSPELSPSQRENLTLNYRRLLRDLNRDQADPLKAMPQDVFESQKAEYEQQLERFKTPNTKSQPSAPSASTQIESNMSLPPAANRFKYDEQQDDLVPASE